MIAQEQRLQVFVQHFQATQAQAAALSAAIEAQLGGASLFYDLKRDIENLEALERALAAAESAMSEGGMSSQAQRLLNLAIVFDREAVGLHEGHTTKESASPDFHRIMKNREAAPEVRAAIWINDLFEHMPRIRGAIKLAKKNIEVSPISRVAASRINAEGIQLVEIARVIWALLKGAEAPRRGLNPISPFGFFVSDLFEAYEVRGNPRAAFRAWVAANSEN